jgi:two-component system sensor histidine kinase RegB
VSRSSSSLGRLLDLEHEPRIALSALVRLRWLAVVGQVGATLVAVVALGADVPAGAVGAVIAFTALTNAGLMVYMRASRPRGWLVQAVLVFDVLALTALLYLTGGAQNPFSVLYLVHVAMAVIVSEWMWTWAILALSAVCYGALFVWHMPLRVGESVPAWVIPAGNWVALVLVAVLIAAFIGRVERSLRQREVELADVRERAGRNERLAALTTLAAGAAHELNTPLGTIAVVAKELEVGAERGADATSITDDARLIRQEVERCREILNRMRLDIGEDLGALKRDSTDVLRLVDHLRGELRAEESGRLKVRCGADVRTVCAPERALEQALLVLLRNAFDASPAASPVELSVRRRNGHVAFVVEDRGSGMSEEMLRRAGEPFFTTKEPGRGMGLGLFLVRLVAERCGAEFWLDSKVGVGTRCVLEVSDSVSEVGGEAR